MRTFISLSMLCLAGCAGAQISRDRAAAPGALVFNGYSNPNVDCYRCHGGEGKGAFLHGPDLSSRVPKMSDDDIANIIKNGKGHMPAFAGKISDSEIAEIRTWLRSSFAAN
jgi:mono/diheme cytochrome c family protein